jgi:hypothetical protein
MDPKRPWPEMRVRKLQAEPLPKIGYVLLLPDRLIYPKGRTGQGDKGENKGVEEIHGSNSSFIEPQGLSSIF